MNPSVCPSRMSSQAGLRPHVEVLSLRVMLPLRLCPTLPERPAWLSLRRSFSHKYEHPRFRIPLSLPLPRGTDRLACLWPLEVSCPPMQAVVPIRFPRFPHAGLPPAHSVAPRQTPHASPLTCMSCGPCYANRSLPPSARTREPPANHISPPASYPPDRRKYDAFPGRNHGPKTAVFLIRFQTSRPHIDNCLMQKATFGLESGCPLSAPGAAVSDQKRHCPALSGFGAGMPGGNSTRYIARLEHTERACVDCIGPEPCDGGAHGQSARSGHGSTGLCKRSQGRGTWTVASRPAWRHARRREVWQEWLPHSAGDEDRSPRGTQGPRQRGRLDGRTARDREGRTRKAARGSPREVVTYPFAFILHLK